MALYAGWRCCTDAVHTSYSLTYVWLLCNQMFFPMHAVAFCLAQANELHSGLFRLYKCCEACA